MGTKTITAPTLTSVISLAELCNHLKIEVGSDDSQASIALAAAHGYAEHYTGIAIGAQVRELALDAFPSAGGIRLPGGVVTSITSVIYTDTTGSPVTLDVGAYSLDDYQTPAWLLPTVDTVWPATLACANAVKVRYACGVDAVPATVRAALLLGAGHFYENREAVAAGSLAEVPLGLKALLDTVRDYSGAV